jgi:hypothetical protein
LCSRLWTVSIAQSRSQKRGTASHGARDEGGCHRTMQPLSLALSQSTRNCSDRDSSSPVTILLIPSMAPVVEKAQQEPHCRVQFRGEEGRG